MKQWVWRIGLAVMGACGALLMACSDSPETAGSSLETENSVAMAIQLADGTPAARTKVMVRPNDYLAGSSLRTTGSETDTSAGIYNKETDENGILTLRSVKPGSYVAEARGEADKAAIRFTVQKSTDDSLAMTLKPTSSLSGQVVMPANKSSVSVGILGLDYVVQTDSLGNFTFESLPEGAFSAVGFTYTVQEIVGVNGNLDSVGTTQWIGTKLVHISAETPEDSVVIGIRLAPTTPDTAIVDTAATDTIPSDTVETDTLPADTVYPYVLFDDFEDCSLDDSNVVSGWYSSTSLYAEAKLTVSEAGGDRDGLAAHFVFSADSEYTWTLMGHAFSEPQNLSDLDSVVFWVRAGDTDSMWVSFSFDVIADSTDDYETGKSWMHFRNLDTTWTRVVVVPDSLIPTSDGEKNAGNIGWDAVKEHVTNLNIFGASRNLEGSHELWIDDIEVYGVKDLELP